jgi:hypothetical protein
MAKGKWLTVEDKQQIKDMLESGISLTEVCQITNISATPVKNIWRTCTNYQREIYYSEIFDGFNKDFPIEFSRFCGVHDRKSRHNTFVHERYEWSLSGFKNFMSDIGPIPKDMIIPTVGRLNHDKGYEPDNFEWQSKSDNSRESAVRNGLGILITQWGPSY